MKQSYKSDHKSVTRLSNCTLLDLKNKKNKHIVQYFDNDYTDVEIQKMRYIVHLTLYSSLLTLVMMFKNARLSITCQTFR